MKHFLFQENLDLSIWSTIININTYQWNNHSTILKDLSQEYRVCLCNPKKICGKSKSSKIFIFYFDHIKDLVAIKKLIKQRENSSFIILTKDNNVNLKLFYLLMDISIVRLTNSNIENNNVLNECRKLIENSTSTFNQSKCAQQSYELININKEFINQVNTAILKLIEIQKIGVDLLASEMRINQKVLNVRIRKIFGITTVKYVLMRKLELSKYLLNKVQYSITEISEICCIQSSAYFSSAFKNQYKISPLRYRQKISTISTI